MRVTYLTGQNPESVDLGPILVPVGAGSLPQGVEGQFIGYGLNGALVAVDAPAGGSIYDDAPLTERVVALEGAPAPTWGQVSGKPTQFQPVDHDHQLTDVSGLSNALAGKADAASVLTTEQLRDLVAAMFQGGTHANASVVYDEASGTLSITASGSTGPVMGQEEVEDFVGGLVTEGTGISVNYDDAGNVLTIALSGESFTTAEKNKLAAIAAGATANATDAQLRDRSTHTGTQPIASVSGLQGALDGKSGTGHGHAISDVSGLQAALDGKQPTTTFKTVNGQAVTGTGNIVTAQSFATDAEALAYSTANPGVVVFSRQVT